MCNIILLGCGACYLSTYVLKSMLRWIGEGGVIDMRRTWRTQGTSSVLPLVNSWVLALKHTSHVSVPPRRGYETVYSYV
jgi:hypothetical protein